MEVKRVLTQVFQWHRGHGEGDAASALGTGGQNDRWQTGASKIEAEERDRKEVCVWKRVVGEWSSVSKEAVSGGEWGVIRELWRKAARCTDGAGR